MENWHLPLHSLTGTTEGQRVRGGNSVQATLWLAWPQLLEPSPLTPRVCTGRQLDQELPVRSPGLRCGRAHPGLDCRAKPPPLKCSLQVPKSYFAEKGVAVSWLGVDSLSMSPGLHLCGECSPLENSWLPVG